MCLPLTYKNGQKPARINIWRQYSAIFQLRNFHPLHWKRTLLKHFFVINKQKKKICSKGFFFQLCIFVWFVLFYFSRMRAMKAHCAIHSPTHFLGSTSTRQDKVLLEETTGGPVGVWTCTQLAVLGSSVVDMIFYPFWGFPFI